MKFLAFFLIAVIACAAVEEQVLDSWLGNIWDKIKKAFKKAWNWLKDHGYLEKIKNALVTLGKAAAVNLCKKWFDESTCQSVINNF
jgi:hypothetical protein